MNYYSEIAQFYDDIAKDYIDYRKATAVLKELIKGKDILEIGTGTGYVAIWLAQQGYNVTAIDSSKSMIEIAKNKQVGLNLKIDFLHQDLQDMDLQEEFDTVVMYESVFCIFRESNDYIVESYILDRDKIKDSLKRIYNHLKNGGLFLIDARDLRNESMQIEIKNGNRYRLELEQPQKDRLKISHIVEKDDKVVAKSVVEKLLLGFDDFKKLIEDIGFEIVGFDETGQIFLILKKV